MSKGILGMLLAGSICMSSALIATAEIDYSSEGVIQKVQEALAEEGFDCGASDGVMGQSTKTAISDYRKKNSLPSGDEIDDELLTSLGYIGLYDDMRIGFEPADQEAMSAMQDAGPSFYEALQNAITQIGVASGTITEYGNARLNGKVVIYVTAKIETDGADLLAECVHQPSSTPQWEVLYIYDADNGHLFFTGDGATEGLYDYQTGLLMERSCQ